MEKTTAKIDVQKLQLLNDRICQTIDALNQVRLSMHGFSGGYGHSVPNYGHTVPSMGFNPYFSAQPFFGGHVPYGFGGYSVNTLPWTGAQIPFYGVAPTATNFQGWNQGPVATTGFAPVQAPVPMSTMSPIY